MIVETKKVQTGFHGFDQTHGGFCSSELSVVTIPQPDSKLNAVTVRQQTEGDNYVLRLLLQSLHQGLNVCYISMSPLSKTRHNCYTNAARQNNCSLKIADIRGKTKLQKGVNALRQIPEMDAIGKTDFIIFDGIESLTKKDLENQKKVDIDCYLTLPKFLKAFSVICQCPVVVVHYEARAKEKQKRGIERLWLDQADLLLSLKRRTFLNPFIIPENQLKGVELRVAKTRNGEGQNISWLV